MGFESYRVELRGGSSTHARADEAVRRLGHAKPDHESIPTWGSTYYTVEDGLHVIEVEVAASPVKVSCRFTLCHTPSIDAAFLGLVRDLMTGLGMEASICDDVLPQDAGTFSAARFAEFAEIVTRGIAARRAEWVANFGPEQFAARTAEVCEKVILPRCTPVTG